MYIDEGKLVLWLKIKTDHKDSRDILGSVLNKYTLEKMAFD